MMFWRLSEAVRGVAALRERQATRRRREAMRRASSTELRVGFGGVLDDGRPVKGGAVKLLPLRERFRSDDLEIHLLYAVSSSQPRFAGDLVKACRRKGIGFVWNQNGVGYPAWAGAESERFNGPMRRLREASDFVIYQSEFCRRSAERFLGGSERPWRILYNPVDEDVFFPGEHGESSKVRLLCAGTHGTRDRVIPCLDALVELHGSGVNASLTVAGRFQWRGGEGDFASEVASRGLAKRVVRVGAFSQADAGDLYRGHDLLLHPKYMDPCPTVVLEALACGLPIVGSRSGGMPELVPESCGVLIDCVEDWNVRHALGGGEIAAAVRQILPRRDEMGLAARAYAVKTFGVEAWLGEHARIFAGLLT